MIPGGPLQADSVVVWDWAAIADEAARCEIKLTTRRNTAVDLGYQGRLVLHR